MGDKWRYNVENSVMVSKGCTRAGQYLDSLGIPKHWNQTIHVSFKF